MEDLKQNRFNKVFTKTRLELAVGIIILIIIGIFFLNLLSNNNGGNNLPSEIVERPFEFTEIETASSTEITYNNYKVVLGQGWEISYAFNGLVAEELLCSNNDRCDIYNVSNGETNYYISLPGFFKNLATSSKFTTEEKPFTFGTVNFSVAQTEVLTVNSESENDEGTVVGDEEGSFVTSEIYGCLDNTICFNSGLLPKDPEENTSAAEAFYDFVTSVTITK